MLGVAYGALCGDDRVEASTDASARRDALANTGVGVFVGVEPSGLVAGIDQAMSELCHRSSQLKNKQNKSNVLLKNTI